MVTICLPNCLHRAGTCLPSGLLARPVALELNKHHAEQV